jgi:hypothetical protein
MITYLRMSSAWHKGNGPVPRSLAGDGEVAAGGQGLLDVPGHAFGPAPPPADQHHDGGETRTVNTTTESAFLRGWKRPPAPQPGERGIGVRRGFGDAEPTASITLGDSSNRGHWAACSRSLASWCDADGARTSPRSRDPAATSGSPSGEGRDAVTVPVPAGTYPGKGRGPPTAAEGGRHAPAPPFTSSPETASARLVRGRP